MAFTRQVQLAVPNNGLIGSGVVEYEGRQGHRLLHRFYPKMMPPNARHGVPEVRPDALADGAASAEAAQRTPLDLQPSPIGY